jgi:hypothetical protein
MKLVFGREVTKFACSVQFTAVVSKAGCTIPWRQWNYLEVGPTKLIVYLFVIEVALDQTLGNWYHFFKPIQHIKNLLQ